jgi:hypothetical protein
VDDSKFETVRRIAVEIGDPSHAVRLYPGLSHGDLNIEMPAEHQADAVFPFGAVAGPLVFDLDEQRTLCGIEVLVPKKGWKRAERVPALPRKVPVRTLRLLGNKTELSFDGPEPTLQYVPSADALVISIEQPSASAHWVGLSDRCFAYVNDGFLGGFVVALRDPRG